MTRYFILILTLLIINGCSSKEAAPINIYSLKTINIMPESSGKHHQQTIKVSFPQTLKEKLTNKMSYSYSLNNKGVYLNSQWSNNSGKLIQGSIIQTLDSSRLFKAVLPYESTAGEDLRLESNIYDFSHHVRGNASYAVVSIQFSLIDTDTGKLIKTKRFSYKKDTQTTDAKGYVEATQRAMERLCRDLVKWLR
jgi:cholesterol transport system auxiliary component